MLVIELAAYLSITQISTEVFECRISPLLKNLKKIFSEVEMKKKKHKLGNQISKPTSQRSETVCNFFNQQHGN